MCRRDELATTTGRVQMPEQQQQHVRYNAIGPLVMSTMMMEPVGIPKIIIHGHEEPLEEEEKEEKEDQPAGSDQSSPENGTFTALSKEPTLLESLSLKRSGSEDSLLSSPPPSASLTSVESDSFPTNDSLEDPIHCTTTTIPEQEQERNPCSPSLETEEDEEEDDHFDTGDASENDVSVMDEGSLIAFDQSISRGLQFDSLSSGFLETPPTHAVQTSSGQYRSPAIKISTEDKIPISLHGPWRGMKRPNLSHRILEELPKQKTVLISPLTLQSIRPAPSTTVTTCACCSIATTRIRKDQVRFDTVHVRYFHQTIGDNPSVPIGTPITLDWIYEDEKELIPIDDFEQSRMVSRKKGNNRLIMHRLALSYYQRRNILSYYAGCTEEQINRAEREVAKARRQRQVTAFFSDLWRVEDCITSLGRKTKRLLQGRQRF